MLQYSQINTIISELLYKHDCVIVPNFGGFVARHYSSSFSKGNNVLYPSTKQLLFNKNLTHNDGLLISALMDKKGLSYSESERLISDYKDYIQSLLSAKKRFELSNIGLLYIDGENSLRFEAKADVNFLLDSFGFEPIIANELVLEQEKPIISKQFEDRKIVLETQKISEKSYRKLAALAVGVPATVAFLLFAAYSKPMKPIMQSSLNPFYTPEKTYNTHVKYGKSYFIDKIETSDLLADANGYATLKLSNEGSIIVAAVNDSIIKLDKTLVRKPTILLNNSTSKFDGKFQVVMGCFGIEQNALKLIQELNSKHIHAAISGKNAKGLFVVSCGGFNTKNEASSLLSSVKNAHPNAWIMAK